MKKNEPTIERLVKKAAGLLPRRRKQFYCFASDNITIPTATIASPPKSNNSPACLSVTSVQMLPALEPKQTLCFIITKLVNRWFLNYYVF